MTIADFARFGERQSFALEVRLIPDPHDASSSTRDTWSFGDLRVFVRGRCLTRHNVPTGFRDEVRWYLAPILRWFDDAWMPLLHEQSFPFATGRHDHTIVRFEQSERILLEDESEDASSRRAQMQAWRKRHALWTGAAGGVFPNIWFRRQSDLCEISYDPGVTVGAPAPFEFQFNRGAALIDVAIVAGALRSFISWGASAGPFLPETLADERLDARKAEEWVVGTHLADVLARTHQYVPRLTNGILYPLSPEVAMFGTLTPDLSDADALRLLSVLEASVTDEQESIRLSDLTSTIAPPTRESSWEQGYDCALQTLERLGATGGSNVDVFEILEALGIVSLDLEIEDLSLRGIAIAGEGFRPTVILNSAARWNRNMQGRRFTIAHELCHILYDRGHARRVTHSSTPWAPEPIERRANAFAAMFLMPFARVDRVLSSVGQVKDMPSLTSVANRLRCGKAAVLEHLKNIDRIDLTSYFKIKAQLSPL